MPPDGKGHLFNINQRIERGLREVRKIWPFNNISLKELGNTCEEYKDFLGLANILRAKISNAKRVDFIPNTKSSRF